MQKKHIIKEDGRQKREEYIIIKILRLLAEEQLISLEEEIRGKEFIRKEAGK